MTYLQIIIQQYTNGKQLVTYLKMMAILQTYTYIKILVFTIGLVISTIISIQNQ